MVVVKKRIWIDCWIRRKNYNDVDRTIMFDAPGDQLKMNIVSIRPLQDDLSAIPFKNPLFLAESLALGGVVNTKIPATIPVFG